MEVKKCFVSERVEICEGFPKCYDIVMGSSVDMGSEELQVDEDFSPDVE